MTLVLSSDDESLVLATPLFEVLDRDTVFWLISGSSICDYPDGGMLFSQGDVADRFFVVVTGHVNLFALTEAGQQTIIEVMERGQMFAEAAMFMNAKFPINADMADGTRLLVVPAKTFLTRLGQRPELATKLFASLALWQHRLMREIVDLKGRSPAQRVGLFLLAHSQGARDSVRLPLTMMELASRIGITPESLSRVMARLRPMGIVVNRNDVIIEDTEALRRFCQAAD